MEQPDAATIEPTTMKPRPSKLPAEAWYPFLRAVVRMIAENEKRRARPGPT